MTRFDASKPLRLRRLAWLFLASRGGLCLCAIAIGIGGRMLVPKPFRWFEAVTIAVILALWPRLEVFVHHLMHNVPASGLYHRHQLHHRRPLDDTTLGETATFLVYNLVPIPLVLTQWAWGLTVATTVLVALTVFEFVHFSTHFRYRPKTAWGMRVRRNHLLHHRDPTRHLEIVFPKWNSG